MGAADVWVRASTGGSNVALNCDRLAWSVGVCFCRAWRWSVQPFAIVSLQKFGWRIFGFSRARLLFRCRHVIHQLRTGRYVRLLDERDGRRILDCSERFQRRSALTLGLQASRSGLCW
jgi:hypothetical protein